MAAYRGSSRRTGAILRSTPTFQSARFHNSPTYSSSSAFASSTASLTSTASNLFPNCSPYHRHQVPERSASPTRVNFRSTSPTSYISSVGQRSCSQAVRRPSGLPKRTCLCSPTDHPGSFRCSLHKNQGSSQSHGLSSNHRLHARRSAMTNSLVRIGGVEGDLVKRALAALIRPSSHQQRRRGNFQPRPSRLSVMSLAED